MSPQHHLRGAALLGTVAAWAGGCESEPCPPTPTDLCPELRAGADQSRVEWSTDPVAQARLVLVFQALGDAAVEVPPLVAELTASCRTIVTSLGRDDAVSRDLRPVERLDETCRRAAEALIDAEDLAPLLSRGAPPTIRVDDLMACEHTCKLESDCVMEGPDVRCPPQGRTARCDAACTGSCVAFDVPASCAGVCDGACVGACEGNCLGTCDGECEEGNGGSCRCDGTCSGRCPERCEGTCSGVCAPTVPSSCDDLCVGTCDGPPRMPACDLDVLQPERGCELEPSCASACVVLTALAQPSWTMARPVEADGHDADVVARVATSTERVRAGFDRLEAIAKAGRRIADFVGTTNRAECEIVAVGALEALRDAEQATSARRSF